ncbi:MAG: OsmC-like protein [Promethearchaeota archaeon]|nr:MAG: OsmC-like protein [Candidatus Lokiarchaeota archaeon]
MTESKSEEMTTEVGLSLEKEMIFKCQLGEMKVEDCYVDETHKKEAEMWGPNPSRMLGMAVLGCLSASFIFCLKKRDFQVEDLDANALVIIRRNEKGFWRVKKIDVTIKPKIDSPEMKKRADQCKKMFEDYCLVTQAVREGIQVDLNLEY